MSDDAVERWVIALEERYLADLTFQEVSRALRALSSTYVERRRKLAAGAALSGTGKRAAFALFYAPLHLLLLRRIVAALPAAGSGPRLLVDLGCGTGAAGAGWAQASRSIRRVIGVDRSAWAIGEASRTYRHFGVSAQLRREEISSARLPKERASFVASYSVNEMEEPQRATLLASLLNRARGGDQVLIVEPLARAAAPWWGEWSQAFAAAGGRADEWRFSADLPPLLAKLDRAAGLDHGELTGRSLWIG